MVNNLFKRSYLHRNFARVRYDNLWNTKGVFTTIRIKGNPPKLIFVNKHIENLNKSLKKIKIDFVLTDKKLNQIIMGHLKKNTKYDHLLRIAVNSKLISFSIRKKIKTNQFLRGILINYIRPKPTIKNLYYKKLLSISKALNYKNEEGILFHKNNLLEGCTTNLIFTKKEKLYIPKNNYYFGITLKILLQYSQRKIIKTNININKLKNFDEILLTGSGKGIVALSSISEINWVKKSDKIYKEFQQAYKSCIKQINET
tara:strand:+ start:39 stop:809 length:771 start_codon:yes stop_codon:yes gene_type:complete